MTRGCPSITDPNGSSVDSPQARQATVRVERGARSGMSRAQGGGSLLQSQSLWQCSSDRGRGAISDAI